MTKTFPVQSKPAPQSADKSCPPIMGASAFIMAETTGVSYGTIALAAILPAFLYYLGVIAQVHFRAGRDNLKGIPKADLPPR